MALAGGLDGGGVREGGHRFGQVDDDAARDGHAGFIRSLQDATNSTVNIGRKVGVVRTKSGGPTTIGWQQRDRFIEHR